MPSFLFLQIDIESYYFLQIKFSDTLSMAAAINTKKEKHLKRDLQIDNYERSIA